MAWRGLAEVNEDMVQNFGASLSSEAEKAFLAIPRAAFVPEDLLDQIYSDSPIYGEGHLRMSAPHIYATVLDALELKPGMSFLNVGSGTGYFSMLVGLLIGPSGVNHGIEYRANIVEHAHECCEEFLQYTPKLKKQICYPQFIVGNCFHLDTRTQQYDRIYVGASCRGDMVDFFLRLLKPNGVVIVPSDDKVLKFINVLPSNVKKTVLNDVRFESLIYPDENEKDHPKLRFAGTQMKTKKIKIYPPAGLLVPKNPARKLLARLRALQDVVDCFSKSRWLPVSFAFVPCFSQIAQLTRKSRSFDHRHITDQKTPPPTVEQTIKFFHQKLTEKKADSVKGRHLSSQSDNERFWSDLQSDAVWESVLNYTYSLGVAGDTADRSRQCVKAYAKCHRSKRATRKESAERYAKGPMLDSVPSVKPRACKLKVSQSVNSASLGDDIRYSMVEDEQSMVDYSGGGGRRKGVVDVVSGELCLVDMDIHETRMLQQSPALNWSRDQDTQLVQVLLDSLGVNTTKLNTKCLGKNISILPSIFSPAVLVRYPKLSSYSPKILTYRALSLMRVVHIIDYVIPYLCGASPILQSVDRHSSNQSYILPSLNESSFEGPQKCAENMMPTQNVAVSKDCLSHVVTTSSHVTYNIDRPSDDPQCVDSASILTNLKFLLPLSARRMGILSELLRATEQPFSDHVPALYIDRRMVLADRLNQPKKSVFYQLYDEFKGQNMNFRCNKRKCEQWWEVKFVGEGIIDQGGGFRDSLAEMSDELCPKEANISALLPLLIKTPNHRDHIGEHRDCFLPSPACKDNSVYRWLGMLMGAAYRSDESLSLLFPPFIWKLLVGEHVTWCTDFAGVDEASVTFINRIEAMTEEDFSAFSTLEMAFTAALSDGRVVDVVENGSDVFVDYENRLKYCELVRRTRMTECMEQMKAMRDGLLSVVPESVLELITFQELERAVCGFSEISLPLLKESIHYVDELTSESECVVQLWKVLENFTMEDRSHFLRFVCGRKCLPAFITLSHMCGEKDSLPSASTCASTLMLPTYSSVEVAEKKLRYAIYNCVAIDTDTNPW